MEKTEEEAFSSSPDPFSKNEEHCVEGTDLYHYMQLLYNLMDYYSDTDQLHNIKSWFCPHSEKEEMTLVLLRTAMLATVYLLSTQP